MRARLLSEAAYTVILIHPFFIVPLTWAWVRILRAGFGVDVQFASDSTSSSTDLGKDGLVWLGWMFVALLTQLLVWPTAAAVRRLPGCRWIL